MRIMHLSRASLMICQFLIPTIEEQKKKGHYVCVCSSDDKDLLKLRDIGIDAFPHRLQRSLNIFKIVREIFRIKSFLIEYKIDVVVCHSPLGAGVGRIAAWLAKTPVIIYFAHGLPCAPGQNFIQWYFWFFIENVLGKITTAILVMNQYDENLCRKSILAHKPYCVYRIPGMGVDLNKFKIGPFIEERLQIEKEFNIPKNKKIFFCVAYLIPEKGIFQYLEASRCICSQRSDVYFLIAGTGPCMNSIMTQCDKYSLQQHFKILGWRTDINKLMRSIDVFVLPTYYFEGLPVSILEAMACEKPVVATHHRGCEDVVKDQQTGFLVPVKQVNPLVEKINQLINDDQLRIEMGKAGRKHIERNYELNYCTQVIVQTIENAIENKCYK